MQQQHVDHKIANAVLEKGTLDIYKTWNHHDRAWVDMRLHESHDDGGFGVSNNTITRLAASYTTNARFVAFLGTFACPAQQVWLPGSELQDPTSWDTPPLHNLVRLHEDLLQNYDCTDQPPPQPLLKVPPIFYQNGFYPHIRRSNIYPLQSRLTPECSGANTC